MQLRPLIKVGGGATCKCGLFFIVHSSWHHPVFKSAIGSGSRDTGFIISDIQAEIIALVVMSHSWYQRNIKPFLFVVHPLITHSTLSKALIMLSLAWVTCSAKTGPKPMSSVRASSSRNRGAISPVPRQYW